MKMEELVRRCRSYRRFRQSRKVTLDEIVINETRK